MPSLPARLASASLHAAGFAYAMSLRLATALAFVMLAAGAVILTLGFPLPSLILAGLIVFSRLLRRGGTSGAYGTARFAGIPDLRRHGLLERDGLILGRIDGDEPLPLLPRLKPIFFGPLRHSAAACRDFYARPKRRKGLGTLIRVRRYTHLCTVAPSGKGKGVASILLNLLAHPGAMVVFDPKRENAQKTAAHRQKRFGHRVIILDPFGQGPDSYNPLDAIDAGHKLALDRCRSLANAIVVRTGRETDPHWNDAAEQFLTAAIAFVVCYADPPERNLQTVRDILASPSSLKRAIEIMQASTAMGGMLKRIGDGLTHFAGEELGSVLTTAGRHTRWMDSLPVAACMRSSSFDPKILRTGKATIYLTIPENQLAVQAPLLRLWIGSLLHAVTEVGPDESSTVLFLLDEAGCLGKMQAVETALTLMRGYGVRLWFYYQSAAQVKECFEHEEKFFDNIDTCQFFGINSYESAELVSKKIGDATVGVVSEQRGDSYSMPMGSSFGQPPQQGSRSISSSATRSEIARRLLKPEEILTLPENQAILFHRNCPPVLANLVRYYEDPEFKRGRVPRPERLGLRQGIAAASVLGGAVMFLFCALLFALGERGMDALFFNGAPQAIASGQP